MYKAIKEHLVKEKLAVMFMQIESVHLVRHGKKLSESASIKEILKEQESSIDVYL